jgi:hypothetical protein
MFISWLKYQYSLILIDQSPGDLEKSLSENQLSELLNHDSLFASAAAHVGKNCEVLQPRARYLFWFMKLHASDNAV